MSSASKILPIPERQVRLKWVSDNCIIKAVSAKCIEILNRLSKTRAAAQRHSLVKPTNGIFMELIEFDWVYVVLGIHIRIVLYKCS